VSGWSFGRASAAGACGAAAFQPGDKVFRAKRATGGLGGPQALHGGLRLGVDQRLDAAEPLGAAEPLDQDYGETDVLFA
jgi:hypothetical protein